MSVQFLSLLKILYGSHKEAAFGACVVVESKFLTLAFNPFLYPILQ